LCAIAPRESTFCVFGLLVSICNSKFSILTTWYNYTHTHRKPPPLLCSPPYYQAAIRSEALPFVYMLASFANVKE
jgi:hypothetical protein